jgi:carbamate kinase
LSYFYNNNITIKLPNQVKKLTRAAATDYYWPSIEVGYEDDNEEAQGLDEPTVSLILRHFVNKGKNTFSQISKYIGGMYAMEFTRRKALSLFSYRR